MTISSMTLQRYSILLCMFFFLSACSFLSPAKRNEPETYLINKVPAVTSGKKHGRGIILVSPPETRAVYNTTKMAYTVKPYQVAYFSKNEWAETPSQMLQPLLVQTLQNTHDFRSVVAPPYSGNFNYMLNTRLIELKQDFTRRTPVMIMSLNAQLFRVSDQQVIASKRFDSEVMIPSGTPYGGVFAANQATSRILEQIAKFCLEHTH